MATSFRVWLVKYEGPTPLAWDNNPDEGMILKEIKNPFEKTLQMTNAIAQGFNEKEMQSPVKLNKWAIVLEGDAEPEIGQMVTMHNIASYN